MITPSVVRDLLAEGRALERADVIERLWIKSASEEDDNPHAANICRVLRSEIENDVDEVGLRDRRDWEQRVQALEGVLLEIRRVFKGSSMGGQARKIWEAVGMRLKRAKGAAS